MAYISALATGQVAERKLLMTVAEWGGTWGDGGYTGGQKEVLGIRTEDSSIEFNPDIETTTDICGITYTDVNKTEPQQDFDPMFIRGGSALGEYLSARAIRNDIAAYNNVFNVYIITAYYGEGTGKALTSYYAVRHRDCSIIPTSIGGDTKLSMPIEVHFSNVITEGTVDKLDATFTFTEKQR